MSAPGSVLKRRKAAATYGKRVSRASYTGQSSSFTSGSSSLQVPKSHPKCNAELETYELSPEPSSSSEEENTGRQPRLDSADPTIEGQRQQTPVDDAQALSKATEKDLPADSIPEHSTKRRKLVHRMASRSSSATASPVKDSPKRTLAKSSSWASTSSISSRSPSPSSTRVLSRQDSSGTSLGEQFLPPPHPSRAHSPAPSIRIPSRSPSPAKQSIFAGQPGSDTSTALIPSAAGSGSGSSTSLKRTYGRSRSGHALDGSSSPGTLRPDTSEQDLLKPLPRVAPDGNGAVGEGRLKSMLKSRESYVEMCKRFGIDESSSEEEEASASQQHPPLKHNPSKGKRKATSSPAPVDNTLQGITTLRTQGQKKQFEDELAYLLEGLTGVDGELPPLGLRRSMALDVLEKIQNENSDFSRALKTLGEVPRVVFAMLDASLPAGDPILDGCAALLLGDALQDRRDAESFFHTASLAGRPLLSQIVALLSKPHSNWPLVEGSQHAKQKRDRADLERLATLVREDPKIWSKELIKPHQPTIEHVILVSMKAILEHSIWGKDDTCSELVQAGAETLLEELIRAHLEQVPSALETLRRSPMGDKIDTASQLVNFGALSTALHILEAVTSSVERLYFNEPTDLQVLPDKFATLLCFCQCVNQLETQAMEAVVATECQILVFKVLIQLTSFSAHWSHALLASQQIIPVLIRLIQASQRSIPETQNKSKKGALMQLNSDILCLALALLTTLLDVDPQRSKRAIRETAYSGNCSGSIRCFPECTCSPSASALECLAGILHGSVAPEAGTDEDDSEFIRNYTSILICLLMLEDDENERILRARLHQRTTALAVLKKGMSEYAQLQLEVSTSESLSTALNIRDILARWD